MTTTTPADAHLAVLLLMLMRIVVQSSTQDGAILRPADSAQDLRLSSSNQLDGTNIVDSRGLLGFVPKRMNIKLAPAKKNVKRWAQVFRSEGAGEQ